MSRFLLASPFALAGAVLAATPALANDQAKMLKQADANKDGIVTSAEAKANRAKIFGKMDRNDDGKVNKSDRPSLAGKGKFDKAFAKASASADANRDGTITQSEWESAQSAQFRKLDLKKDGKLDKTEMAKAGA